MGQLTLFTYVPSTSLAHGLDVRCKLCCLSLMSIATLQGGPVPLSLITAMVAGLLIATAIRPLTLFRELKLFFLLVAMVFISRSVTTGGEPIINLWGISATKQGIVAGALLSWKFVLVMLMGIVFTKTTKPSHVKGAVQWFLRPIPFVPETRVAVMISLFLRFMPLILTQASEVSQAQQARCFHLEKNPVKRLLRPTVPLLKKTFQSADQLALAMEARSYSDKRTDPVFIRSGQEPLILALCFLVLGLSFIV
ncbi:MAG: energy-coupling factor transporter transmembrane protein EcfT [Desulfobacterium sp.]|nr:energy-coupling factor transporter transmembrane protein EcfT [Desulfobacterium sp.]